MINQKDHFHSIQTRKNGQVDSSNKEKLNYLKKRLEATKERWPEELPGLLWAYCLITKSSTGETLFSCVYGAEALILIKIGEPSLRFSDTTKESSSAAIATDLDLVKGR